MNTFHFEQKNIVRSEIPGSTPTKRTKCILGETDLLTAIHDMKEMRMNNTLIEEHVAKFKSQDVRDKIQTGKE